MTVVSIALACVCTALAGVYMWRLSRLHIRSQPALFVLTQAAAGCHALLVWLSATEGTWGPADVAGVLFSALYLWRSRQRMHDYISGEAEAGRPMDAVPDTVIIRRSPPACQDAQDRRAA